jgi:hypothetical protein
VELLRTHVHVLPQTIELIVDGGLDPLRLEGRDERSRVELAATAEASLEPDRELAGHPQLVERLPVLALALMDGRVAHIAQNVDKRPPGRTDDHLLPDEPLELLAQLASLDDAAHR